MTATLNTPPHTPPATISHTGSLLRFVTCGSVDDGKSTLIGRLLYDSKSIFEDQLAAVEKASGRYGTTGSGKVDLALLTDGLKAEREQGITIDVAYRYFSTPRRPFIIADCPGHEQYTRNMATGASNADAAIVLIDARHGVVTQTRRHAFIVALLGIRHVVLAVNKMDLVGWDRARFEQIVRDFRTANERIGVKSYTAIPMSALNGDNVTARSSAAAWYEGPALLEWLEAADLGTAGRTTEGAGFRLPVQWVSRPDSTFRGYMGEVASGVVRAGDEVVVLPARVRTRVTAVYDADGPVAELGAGRAATITLANEVDASRGDTIAAAARAPKVASKVLANLVWFSLEAMQTGKSYRLKQGTRLTTGTVTRVSYRVDVNTLEQHPATKLEVNDIALVEVESARPLVFDPYAENRTTGSFVLIDRVSGNTVAAGMIVSDAADAATSGPVTALQRAVRLGQQAGVVSITGDAGAAREAAVALERVLFMAGHFAAVVEPGPDAAAAVRALTGAGLIAIVPGVWAGAGVTAAATTTSEPGEVAQMVHQRLSTAGVLTASAAEFEI